MSFLNFSSMSERGVPVPCTKHSRPNSSKNGSIRSPTSSISLKLVKSTKALPWVMPDKMLDPMDQAGLICRVARVGHFARDEEFHLPLVIKGRTGLQQHGLLPADLAGEIEQGTTVFDARRVRCLRSCSAATARVALVMMTEVSAPNRRWRRKSATLMGAALRARFRCVLPVRSTQ